MSSENVRPAGLNGADRALSLMQEQDYCWRDPDEGVRDMLILTRRVGETLMIGDEVTVTVLGVKGNQVRIGVNAPKNVSVHREEIYERIRRENEGEEGDAGYDDRG